MNRVPDEVREYMAKIGAKAGKRGKGKKKPRKKKPRKMKRGTLPKEGKA